MSFPFIPLAVLLVPVLELEMVLPPVFPFMKDTPSLMPSKNPILLDQMPPNSSRNSSMKKAITPPMNTIFP